MPYTNVPDELQDKMESCVQQLEAEGKDKETAIRICYASVVEGKSLEEAQKSLVLDEIKIGARNNTEDKHRIREIRKAARQIHDITLEMEPKDSDDEPDTVFVEVLNTKKDVLVSFGHEVKALGDGKLGGYLVRYGDPNNADLEGEFFTPQTDFGDADTSPVYYHHGLDSRLGTRKLAKAKLTKDEFGIWAEAQLQLRDEYEQFIYQQAEAGKMGWSSGTLPHLVEREPVGKAIWLKSWPIGLDASITPTPAEPRNVVVPLKSIRPQDIFQEAQSEGGVENPPIRAGMAEIKILSNTQEEGSNMGEEFVTKEELTRLSGKIDAILDGLKSFPAAKDAGYIAPDSEKDHPESKSFADFLFAVRNGNSVRLKSVYKTALSEDAGETGGYLVPTEYGAPIMAEVGELSVLRKAKATIVPMTRREIDYPVFDIETAPTAGNTAYAGGAYAAWLEEAATLTESEPKFRIIKLVAHKLGGYSLASNEFSKDAMVTIETILQTSFVRAIASQENYQFFRGDGVGKPLGILNSGALVSVTRSAASAVALADVAGMFSRLLPESYLTAVWFINPTIWSKLIQIVSSPITWVENARERIPVTLLGLPVYATGALPALNTAGDILLVDPKYYLVADRGTVEIAYSPHYKFINDQGTWRFIHRVDGQPMVQNTVTLENASTTVSPFVALAAG